MEHLILKWVWFLGLSGKHCLSKDILIPFNVDNQKDFCKKNGIFLFIAAFCVNIVGWNTGYRENDPEFNLFLKSTGGKL